MDGTGAEGIRVATVTDGVSDWIVVEWQVNVFGTTSNRHFQAWIGDGGPQDITFAYDPGALPADPGQPFQVGAENSIGQGDITTSLPTEDLRVMSSAPTPGESYTYSLTLKGKSHGVGTLTTSLTANGVIGTTIVKTHVTVNH